VHRNSIQIDLSVHLTNIELLISGRGCVAVEGEAGRRCRVLPVGMDNRCKAISQMRPLHNLRDEGTVSDNNVGIIRFRLPSCSTINPPTQLREGGR
jgi:hypothetical protein